MASSSGSFNMSSGYGTITINWWKISHNTSNNTTRLGWNAIAAWSGSTWIRVNLVQVWINGGMVLNRGAANTYGGQFANGEIDIAMDNNGGKVFGANGQAAIYTNAVNASGNGTWELPQVPRAAWLTNLSQDINDESSPWIEFSNPAGFQTNMWFEFPNLTGTTRYFQRNNVGSRANWNLTTAERDQLRTLLKNNNSSTIRYVLETNVNGTWMSDWRDRVYTIVNANPIFTDFSFRDSNATTVAVTGNNQTFIQGQSIVEATVSQANAMQVLKKATAVNYKFAASNLSQTLPYSATDDVVASLGALGVNANTALVTTATDSRGNTAAVTKTLTVLPYQPPQVSPIAQRVNNFETSTKIKLSGIISRLTVDGVDKNTVATTNGLQYRAKKTTTTTWGAWVNVASTTSGGNVSAADFFVNLDRDFAWDVEFKISDKVSSTSVALVVGVGIPIFRIGTDGRVYNNEKKLITQDDDLVFAKLANMDLSTFGNVPLNGTVGMPYKSRAVSMGYGTSATLYRFGNLVFCHMNTVTTSFAAGDGVALVETMPAGYRPITDARLSAVATAGYNANALRAWDIQPSGSMTYGGAIGITNLTRLMGSAVWITVDAFPA